MCRLLSQISLKEEDITYWFFDADLPFKRFSEEVFKPSLDKHDSGWGIGIPKGNSWKIFKEGQDEVKKYNFDKIKEFKSQIILLHLRHASVGNKNTINAHPFSYKNWIFEHNGGGDRDKLIAHLNNKFKKEIKGETDSEILFLLIMQFYEKGMLIQEAIGKAMGTAKQYSYTGLNFILSNGEKVYAYRDANPRSDRKDYLSLYYLKLKDKIIICSEPLTPKDNWIPMKIGELIEVNKELGIIKEELFVNED